MTGSINEPIRHPDAAPPEAVSRRDVGSAESSRASRRWWDAEADEYQRQHGQFLGSGALVWGPEGLNEAAAGLLGEVAGRRVLEVGCGAAAGSRWLAQQGAIAVGLDLSMGQLRHSHWIDAELGQSGQPGQAVRRIPLVCGDAERLPLADASFDIACSAYGALPFVADAAAVMAEVARVLRPGGRWVFSVTHPIRWAFPDDPGPQGLVASRSYFDRLAYVEQDEQGVATYVEHHRTVGDWVRLVTGAGFRVLDLVEPEWPAGHDRTWGGWSPLRGRILPGTLILRCELDPDHATNAK